MADPKTPHGPTGVFNRGGPITPGDRGGLVLRFRVFPRRGVVECDFGIGTRVAMLLLTVEEARGFARITRERIKRGFGTIEYSDHDFPLRVEPIPAERVIKITFPFLVEVLGTNPHVFLVLADRLDKAAAELGPLH